MAMNASFTYDDRPYQQVRELLQTPADLSVRALTAWAKAELPCGCTLVMNDGACAVELRFCEAHKKVKATRRDPKWPSMVAAAVAAVARRKATFTTDDVWEELGADAAMSGDPRAIGPAMSTAEREGLVEQTDDHVKSARRECHGRPVRVWRSLVLRGAKGGK